MNTDVNVVANKLRYNPGKVLLIDASHALHRSLRVPELWGLTAKVDGKEMHTGGIMGTMTILNTVMAKFPEHMPILVYDKGLCKRRLKEQPNYKHYEDRLNADVNEMTAEEQQLYEEGQEFRKVYNESKVAISEISKVIGVPYIEMEGVEGDDIIAALTTLPNLQSIVLVTEDKDYIQMLGFRDDIEVKMYRPIREELLTQRDFYTEWGSVDNFVLAKSMVGDPSDNIPKAADKVGIKTVLKVIEMWRTKGYTNKDICSKGTLLEGEYHGELKMIGRGKNRKIDYDTTPKVDNPVIQSIVTDMKPSKALRNLVEAMCTKNQIQSNLEMIDLRKIEIDLVQNVFNVYLNSLRDLKLETNFMEVIKAFGKYRIIDFDRAGLLYKLKKVKGL